MGAFGRLRTGVSAQRKLKIYAIRSPLSVSLRIRFGMVGCDVLRNTSKDWAVVDGIAAMAENAGALRDVFWAPWHLRHVASANCFPAAGSPTCWPNAMAMLDRRSGALHADERTHTIGAPFGANLLTTAQDRPLAIKTTNLAAERRPPSYLGLRGHSGQAARRQSDPMRHGSYSLREFLSDVVRIDCQRCGREGRYRRERLIKRFGADAALADVLMAQASCERRSDKHSRLLVALRQRGHARSRVAYCGAPRDVHEPRTRGCSRVVRRGGAGNVACEIVTLATERASQQGTQTSA